MVLLLVVLFISWISFLFLLWGWVWWWWSSSHDSSLFSLRWSSFFCLYLASFLQVPKLGFILLLESIFQVLWIHKRKKEIILNQFLNLAKNEIYYYYYYYYCYYFQEVHFWPCELARPKNAFFEFFILVWICLHILF